MVLAMNKIYILYDEDGFAKGAYTDSDHALDLASKDEGSYVLKIDVDKEPRYYIDTWMHYSSTGEDNLYEEEEG